MGSTFSRRRIVTLGTAAASGAAVALAGSDRALASSARPAAATAAATALDDIFDVRSFGAKGDGVTIDTGAINNAIAAAAANKTGAHGGPGGTVYFPAGTYPSYSIHLASNVALFIAEGATILAAAPSGGQGYDPPEQPGAGNDYQDFGHSHWHNSLIWGVGLDQVAIYGPGTIDGQGLVTGGSQESVSGQGNKILALKQCTNVLVQDITMYRGGHFCILPTGVNNFRIDGLVIDTNRDGIDIDCCKNVRLQNTTVNSPNDDAIVLKSSYALDDAISTENVTIDNCMVSGYDLGTVLDGTYQGGSYGATGRIKFGTESNGGFKNIAISNIIFDHCRGLALETVDGALLQDVTISNITMRSVQTPIFLRLGARMRGPSNLTTGSLQRVSIGNVTVVDADPHYPSTIAGIPGHPIRDVRIGNVRQYLVGGLTPADANQSPPELVDGYPENNMFGTLPAYGFYIRHAENFEMNDVAVQFEQQDTRPAFVLDDVTTSDFHHVTAGKVPGTPTYDLTGCSDFTVTDGRPVRDIHLDHVTHRDL